MGLDSLTEVRARIASIQQGFEHAFATSPVRSNQITASPKDSSFADLLASSKSSRDSGFNIDQLRQASGINGDATAHSAKSFVADALSQAGKVYRFGAEASANNDNPTAFDCSELVQWSAARQGIQMPEGSWQQYLQLKQQGNLMSVDEALRTPGALLFSFSHEPTPGGGRPSSAHVAISLGDGRTIEARGRSYGVGVFDAGNRFTYAGRIPGLTST